jgi:hypothetical protein|tara:strand:+ start:2524 stop:3450 length:927 start_codon:yes stop_codon:yes gene_type:complete
MTKKFYVRDHDVFYLSYDEPNAEKNYADICNKIPWVKRVHGVEGSDAAHKACAEQTETERFTTVDGDNIINPKWLDVEIEFDEKTDLANSVISWCGYNVVNGLIYGNGGLKCWPKQYVLDMKTHENADPNDPHSQIDFCWDIRYLQTNQTYSDVYNNYTPAQSWRAGFREGVKMSLDRGVRVNINDFKKNHWKNLNRMYIWQMVGSDIENGIWAIYGARLGTYMTMCTDWDIVHTRDFKYLNNMWEEQSAKFNSNNIEDEIKRLGEILVNEVEIPIGINPLTATQSKFFKQVYQNPIRGVESFIVKKN